MSIQIQFRRATAAQWTAADPILAEGEPGIDVDNSIIKIGDGVKHWSELIAVPIQHHIVNILTSPTERTMTPPGQLDLYVRAIAGRLMPKVVGPNGVDTALQPIVARNKIGTMVGLGNMAGFQYSGSYQTITGTGTVTIRNVETTGGLLQRLRRTGMVSASTANAVAALISKTYTNLSVGNPRLPGGGFFKVMRFAISDAAYVPTARMGVGVLAGASNPITTEPHTWSNSFVLGHKSNDTSLSIFHAGSVTGANIPLGGNFPCNAPNTDVYEFAIFSPPDAEEIRWEVTRLNTGHVAYGVVKGNGVGSNIPLSSTMLSQTLFNRANGGATQSVAFDLISDYLETDF